MLDARHAPLERPPKRVVGRACCRGAYLRGALLGGGSLSGPRSPHLELRTTSLEGAEFLRSVAAAGDVRLGVLDRGRHAVAYAKGLDAIESVLTLAGASDAVLAFEERSIVAAARGEANRLANADHANLVRTSRAAQEQLEAVRALQRDGTLERLPDRLHEIARLRLRYPHAAAARARREVRPADDEGIGPPPLEKAAGTRLVRQRRGPEGELRGRPPPPRAVLRCRRRTGSEFDDGRARTRPAKTTPSTIVRHFTFVRIRGNDSTPAKLKRIGCPAMEAAFASLKERIGEIHDLDRASSLLGWDQQVKMPPGGAGVRAEQLATLERLAHEALTSDEMGRLLDELAPHEDSLDYDSDEASLIRVVRRDWEKARRVPAELRAEMTRAASLAMPVWVKARQESDFSQFLPGSAVELRAAAPLRRVLRRLRRALRRPPRRLRARDEDRRGACRLRPAEAGAGAARRGCAPGRRASDPRRHLPDRRPEGIRAEGDRALRLRPVRVAARHCRAPLRGLDRDRRHPADDALLRRQPRRPLRDDARVRPRPLRARRLARARAHAARARGLARPARVAEPASGRTWSAAASRSGATSIPRLQRRSRRRSAARRSRTGTARSTGSRRR